MPAKVRINDLRDPVLTELQKAAIARAELNPVVLTEEAVLGAAVDGSGLHNFGSEDFRERLRIWLADIDNTEMNAFGRAAVFRMCVRFATTRLRVQELLTRHPEIHDVKIVNPVVVIGLPRSGTTHLVNLLAADSRRRSLPYWEACEPIPVPGEEADSRWMRCEADWRALKELLPLMVLMHPMDPDHVHEDLELQGPDFSSYQLEWLGQCPNWRDHYLRHDQTPHYEYLRTMLKVLQWQRGPGEWVLKCPQHFEQIAPLMRVFPDANVVMTHRDPVAVIQSAVTMMAYNGRLRYKSLDIDSLMAYWSDRIERLLRAAVRDAPLIPEQQRFDVPFDDFMTNDMAMIVKLYEKFGLGMDQTVTDQLRRYIADHPRGREGQVVYDLEADFGVDPNELRMRFSFYTDAFAVTAEGRGSK